MVIKSRIVQRVIYVEESEYLSISKYTILVIMEFIGDCYNPVRVSINIFSIKKSKLSSKLIYESLVLNLTILSHHN